VFEDSDFAVSRKANNLDPSVRCLAALSSFIIVEELDRSYMSDDEEEKPCNWGFIIEINLEILANVMGCYLISAH